MSTEHQFVLSLAIFMELHDFVFDFVETSLNILFDVLRCHIILHTSFAIENILRMRHIFTEIQETVPFITFGDSAIIQFSSFTLNRSGYLK